MTATARTLALAALVLVALAALATPADAQCALCRESLRKSGDAGLIQGIYVSILLLTFAPTALLGGIGILLVRAHRRKLALEAASKETASCAT